MTPRANPLLHGIGDFIGNFLHPLYHALDTVFSEGKTPNRTILREQGLEYHHSKGMRHYFSHDKFKHPQKQALDRLTGKTINMLNNVIKNEKNPVAQEKFRQILNGIKNTPIALMPGEALNRSGRSTTYGMHVSRGMRDIIFLPKGHMFSNHKTGLTPHGIFTYWHEQGHRVGGEAYADAFAVRMAKEFGFPRQEIARSLLGRRGAYPLPIWKRLMIEALTPRGTPIHETVKELRERAHKKAWQEEQRKRWEEHRSKLQKMFPGATDKLWK